MQPDAPIIQNPTPLHQVDVFSGLQQDGYVPLNTHHTFASFGLSAIPKERKAERFCTLAAQAVVAAATPC